MDVSYYQDREIQKINEARIKQTYISFYSDPVKNAMAIFLAEVMLKSLKEPEGNKPLFDFLIESLNIFDLIEEGKANFHIVFLLKISEFLGFRINRESYSERSYLDLLDGIFSTQTPQHTYFLNLEDSFYFNKALCINYSQMNSYKLSRSERNSIIENILTFYKLHIPEFKEIKSYEVPFFK